MIGPTLGVVFPSVNFLKVKPFRAKGSLSSARWQNPAESAVRCGRCGAEVLSCSRGSWILGSTVSFIILWSAESILGQSLRPVWKNCDWKEPLENSEDSLASPFISVTTPVPCRRLVQQRLHPFELLASKEETNTQQDSTNPATRF